MATILIIEDNPDNMALIEEILDDEGFDLIKADRAKLGIEHLREQQIDLVLMDISLPEMSGLEAAKIIKADNLIKHVPLVALTAHSLASDKKNALTSGFDYYLTKPINENQLLTLIREILG